MSRAQVRVPWRVPTLVLFALLFAALSIPAAAATRVDLITNSGFEDAALPPGFEAISPGDGATARTTIDPIAGTASLKVTVNSYGRVVRWHQYGWGSGPFARSVTFSARLRVDSSTAADRQLTACAIAYFLDSPEPVSLCRDYPVDPAAVVDVRLHLDTDDRQLNYVFPQFSLNDSGTIEATVDEAHFEIVETPKPEVPVGFELVDLITNNDFDDASAPLGFEPNYPADGSVAHHTTNPVAGSGSLQVTVNAYGRVVHWNQYGWGSGPFAHSVTLSAVLRVDASTLPGRNLEVCAIAYFLDSQEPQSVCQTYPVDPSSLVDVDLTLPANGRQLNYLFPQFKLNDSGTIEVTVDEVHYYVVQPSSSCTEDGWSCTEWSECGTDGTQARSCTLVTDCPDVSTPGPATTRSCTPPSQCTQDVWSCSDWSACDTDGTQTRSCALIVDCPADSTPAPPTTQSCAPLPPGGGQVNPTRPQNFYAAGISSSKVFLKWSAAASPAIPGQPQRTVTGYRVYRDGVQVATVTGALRYEDGGLTPDSTYGYTLVAVDDSGAVSEAATATASTLPAMPVGTAASHPVLLPASELEALAAGGAQWDEQKAWCEARLGTLVRDLYAGWEWHDAAVGFSTCYRVSKLRNEAVDAEKYAKKALAMAVVLARHHNLGTPANSSDNTLQPAGLADGTRTVFPLPFVPMNPAAVRVFLTGTREIALARSTQQADALGAFAPIMKISEQAGGPAAWAPSDYQLRYRDGSAVFRLAWTGANQPAEGSAYYVTVADGNATQIASGFVVDPATLTLTFATPPAANQAVMVSYLGSAYEQTGNGLGGVNAVQPDGPGYPMRTYNPGLATAYDALLDSPLLTPALRAEFYGVLNRQVEWCTSYCYENNGSGGNVGNYFIRGLLGGTFATAYATEGENPQAQQLKAQANTLLGAMIEGAVKVLPGGYGPQGQYANGTTIDILAFLSRYRDVTGLDLAPRLDWTHNVVPATIHATKPDLATFYDGGDWSELPATPLEPAMQGFLRFQPSHPDAPFARRLVEELGGTPWSDGPVTDYRASFPLSYSGTASPFYARSDWSGSAVWMSLAANDTGAVVHQHRDAGHFTIQRGGDSLLKTAGGYDRTDTLYHNSLLIDDRNIPGYTPVSVYPPAQGWWGSDAQLTRHADGGAWAYAQADLAHAYVNNDGVRNSVKRALRSIVYLRPGTFVVFDQVQSAHPAIRKTFNLNFGGTLTSEGGVWTAASGQSKLFMRSLLNDATPVVTQISGSNISTSMNYQETISGNLKDVFLHVFQATDAGATSMAPAAAMRSVDASLQGAEVVEAGKSWAVLFAAYERVFAGPVQYVVPTGGAHGHLLNDLLPSSPYVAAVTDASGEVLRTIAAATDANGTLSFDTMAGETHFYVTPGTTLPATIPPVTTDPNA